MLEYDLRKLQITELGMLKDIHKLCSENGIKYFLFYGTLLGAVRHGGFIPWDDDIDIIMMHEDYKKFTKVCLDKLPKKYFLQNCDTDKDFPRVWSKVRINDTCCMEKEFRHLNIHYGIDMDIFELIYISENKYISKIQKLAAYIYRLLKFEKAHLAIDKELREKKHIIIFNILPNFIKEWLGKITERIAYSTADKKSKYVLEISEMLVLDSSLFENKSEIIFEESNFYAPVDHKKILELLYGDYMKLPAQEDRYGHGERIVDFEKSYEIYRL